jgi:putative nucleotide binding protein
MKDENLIVLDFLARGHASSRRGEPLVQGIGKKFMSLLEVVVKENVQIKSGDELYIGDKERGRVKYIKGRIKYNLLTNFAKSELEHIVESLIDENQERFVNFFNIAGPISTRLHSLELLQGVGKKHMWAIIKERKNKKFENFDDLKKRVDMLPDPKKMVKKRIVEELKEVDRYKLFVI